MDFGISLSQLFLSSALTLANGEVLENPVLRSLQLDSPQYKCFQDEIHRQTPKGLLAEGAIHLMGPSVVRSSTPMGSVIEIGLAAPNAKPWPRYLSWSIHLETPDRSLWEQKIDAQGISEFRASQVANPASVFERLSLRYLYDFDLKKCLSF